MKKYVSYVSMALLFIALEVQTMQQDPTKAPDFADNFGISLQVNDKEYQLSIQKHIGGNRYVAILKRSPFGSRYVQLTNDPKEDPLTIKYSNRAGTQTFGNIFDDAGNFLAPKLASQKNTEIKK